MAIRARIKASIRAYLGLDVLVNKNFATGNELAAGRRHDEAISILSRMNSDALTRHSEMVEILVNIVNALTIMNQRLTVTHIERPAFKAGLISDWDTIQQAAMSDFDEDPKKGN